MIRFHCECGKLLQAREENAGQEVRCPSCGRQLFVPAASADAIRAGEDTFRPSAPADFEDDEPDRGRGRPPREEAAPVSTSGKATTSLILGILSLFCNVLAGLPALIVGLLALRDINRSRGRLGGHGLALAGVITACAGTLMSCVLYGVLLLPLLLLPAVQKVREAAARAQSANNLKQMSLAMMNYHDTQNHFPAAAICDKNGKPLLSWRVALLPYLNQQQLYAQFKLDEPWDSPNNIKLLGQMPMVYSCPAAQTPPGETVYQVFVGNGAIFETTRGRPLTEILDGTSNTILIVEANQSVPWTKPDDLPYNPNGPLPPLGGHSPNGFMVVSADGAVHFIPKNTPEQTLRPLITRNDGILVPFP
jgi:hypothetical protein